MGLYDKGSIILTSHINDLYLTVPLSLLNVCTKVCEVRS